MTPTPPLGSPQRAPKASGDAAAPTGGAPPPAASPWSKRWLLFAVALAVVSVAYAVGRIQGALALSQAEQQSAADRGAWQTSLAACETDRGLRAARRSLSLVATSLDRRNFGVAENHRRDALQALEQPAFSRMPEVGKLAATVRALNLGVDPDPGAKREQVIAVSEALDRIVPSRSVNAPLPAASVQKAP
jgi:hypothetical protein